MKPSHNPSPWTWERNGDLAFGVYDANGNFVAELVDTGTVSPRTPEQMEQAARLIAAAPDLLSELEAVERWMSGYGTATQGEMRQRVRATLAKLSNS